MGIKKKVEDEAENERDERLSGSNSIFIYTNIKNPTKTHPCNM